MTDARYEIIVEVNGENRYLDTYKYEPITLTYNVADIQDISKRNSSFSRTITLPETQNNRDVFNNISDLAADSTFNPNLKAKAWILVDTVAIFEGYLQLKSVTLSDTLENKYEVVIFADNDTFFTRLGERYIEDLDYSDLNHIYGTTSIINSWTSGQQLGYFYPLIDYGQGWTIDMISPGGTFSSATNSYVNYNEMFPATYVKTIWDKIFNDADFYYESEFLNSQKFKDLLIPFNGTELKNGPTFSDGLIFNVGVSLTQSLAPFNFYSIDFNNESFPYSDFNNLWFGNYYQQGADVSNQRFVFGFDYNIDQAGSPSQLTVKIYREFVPSTGLPAPSWSSGLGFEVYSVNFDDAQFFDGPYNIVGSGLSATASYRMADATQFTLDIDGISGLRPLYPNEKLRLVIINNTAGTITFNEGYLYNEIYPVILEGGLLDYKNNVPKKVKQKDFVTSIVKMFNLYIEPSKEYPNTLIIEPRDDYYASGQIKDWTDKIDLNVDIKEQILADTQNRQILFSYKDDKDRLNTFYKSTYNEIYGQYLYDSENEFSAGIKKIEVIFSPTPVALVPGSFNFPIPRIVKDDINYNQLPGSRIDSNIRIVTRYNDGNNNGLLSFDNGFDTWGFEGVEYSAYPYVGHYDNPYTPTDDLNWGQLREQYFPSTVVTDDNLVNNYWIKFLDETTDRDSRIITVEMYLTPVDIYNFRFNDIIYLFFNGSGHYYKVNKISNYDPGLIKTCQVELIKAKDIPKLKRTIRKFQKPTSLLQAFSTNVINLREGNTVISGGSITTGTGNTVRGNDLIINGDDNNVRSNNNIINGDSNNVLLNTRAIIINGDLNNVDYDSNRVIINGDTNLISASSSNINISGSNNIVGTGSNDIQVLGSNNIIAEGLTNSFVFGNGVIATQSNITYIGNDVVFLGAASQDLQSVLDTGNTATSNGVFISTGFSPSPGWFYMNDDTVFISSGGTDGIVTAPDLVSIDIGTTQLTVAPDLVEVNSGNVSLNSSSTPISPSIQPGYVEVNLNEKKWYRTAQKTTTGTGTVTSDPLCGLGTTGTANTPTLIRGVIVVKNGSNEQIVTFDDAYGASGNQLNPGAITFTGYGSLLLGGLTSFMTGTNDYYLILQGITGTTTYDIISITTYSL